MTVANPPASLSALKTSRNPVPPESNWAHRIIKPMFALSGTAALVAVSAVFFFTGGSSILVIALSGSGVFISSLSTCFWIKPSPKENPLNPAEHLKHQKRKYLAALASTVALAAIGTVFTFLGGSILAIGLGGSGLILGGFSSSYWGLQIFRNCAKSIDCAEDEKRSKFLSKLAENRYFPQKKLI